MTTFATLIDREKGVLADIHRFLSLKETIALQTTGKYISDRMSPFWGWPRPYHADFYRYSCNCILPYWKHLCSKRTRLGSIAIRFNVEEMDILLSLLQRCNVDELRSLKFMMCPDVHACWTYPEELVQPKNGGQPTYALVVEGLVRHRVGDALRHIDSSYTGLMAGHDVSSRPLTTIADCCAHSLESLQFNFCLFGRGRPGYNDFDSPLVLSRFQSLQSLTVNYGNPVEVLQAISQLSQLKHFKWQLLCCYNYFCQHDEEYPRLTLQSPSMETFAVNTFKGVNLRLAQVDCPRLEKLIVRSTHDMCQVMMNTVVSVAPNFEVVIDGCAFRMDDTP